MTKVPYFLKTPLLTLLTLTIHLGLASHNSVAIAAINFTQDSSCKLALSLNETTGNVTSMCNNTTGASTGATPNATGHFNKAFNFDGNDYLKGNKSLSINGQNMTVTFWADVDLQNWQENATFVAEPYDAGGYWDNPYVNFKISRAGSTSRAFFHYSTNHTLQYAQSEDNFFQSGYHHYAFVKSDGTMKFYRDGVQIGPYATVPSGNLTGSFKWFVGIRADYDPGEFGNYKMDEVGVFSRDLTVTEIASIKDNGLDGQQGQTPPSCQTTHSLCATQTACEGAGFYWYDNQCHDVPQEPPSSGNKTFYIRVGGGTSAQCNGLYDLDYPGSGTTQNCAFNHPNWALPMAGQPVPVLFQGGDTMIINPGNYEFGWNAPNHPSTPNCHWSFPYACTGLGPLPSGTTQNPTKILGKGWDTGCDNPPQLWGSERVQYIVSLQNSNNIEMRCLDITDHSDCIENQGSDGCNKSSYPYGPWAGVGVVAKDSYNVLLEHVKVHGMASKGIHVGRISNYELRDSVIRANGFVGWDGDLGYGINSSNSGYIKFIRTTIEYNGCAEDYPPSAESGHVGISKCWSQGQGGYGDGIGTNVTNGDWYFEDSAISHNVSDGIDLLYAGVNGSLVIKRGRFEGNAGNQIKSGFDTDIEDAKIIGNCAYFTAFGNNPNLIWNGGSGGAQWDGDCRALGNTIAFDINKPGQTFEITSSTVTGQGDVLLQSSGDVCNGSESIHGENNIMIGGKEFYHYGDTGLYYSAGATGNGDGPCGNIPMNNSNSIIYKVKDEPCPQATIMCVDPMFNGVTITTEMVPQNIHNYDVTLSTLSPAIDAGSMITGYDNFDNSMFDRGFVWDFGAFETNFSSGAVCGNENIESGELCDDGSMNGQPGYCNTSCSGYVELLCGNGIVDGGEVCDNNTVSCQTAEGYNGAQSCNSSCSGFDTCATEFFCGDGAISAPEICDGDLQSCVTTGGYTGTIVCNSVCSGYESCESNLFCGDALLNGNEVCDSDSLSCETAEGYAGIQDCNSSCSGYNSCSTDLYCGDSQVDSPEVCDGGVIACTTPEGYAGTQDCNTSCSGYNACSTNLYCGDNQLDSPEVCDGGIIACTTPEGYAGVQSCNSSCSEFDYCQATQYCGDEAINGNEQCDDGNTISGDGCSSTCQIESNNNPPVMTYVTNIFNVYIMWSGYDPEDSSQVRYSYSVDGGAWSNPTGKKHIRVSQLNLSREYHTFAVKAIDPNGAESTPMSIKFNL